MRSRVNLLAPEVRANPYPVYAELRRNAPVSQVDPDGLWVAARYDDIITVMKNPQLFSSEGIRQTYRPKWIPDYPLADSMLGMDPPHHTRLRSLINRAFGNSVLTRLEPRIRNLAHQIVNHIPPGCPVNFVETFSSRVPIAVLGDLVGFCPSFHQRIQGWADILTEFTGVRPDDSRKQELMRNTVAEAREYFRELIEQRRREPRDDLVSELLRARMTGEELTDSDLMGFMFLLLIGGLETTVHLLSYCALKLQEDPELMTRLRTDPSLVPRFIDEMLRHSGPAHGLMRVTTDEVELGGARIPRGTRLLLLIASANRDEAHFVDAERFDVDRPGSHNLPFGHGIHFCLGSQLARLEARLAIEALLHRFERLTPGNEPTRWNFSLVIRGPMQLSLVAHPA